MTSNITFEEVISILGQPNKQDAKNAYWQCPECFDTGKNNVVYTFSNGLFKSWCCDSCRKIMSEIMKNRKDKPMNKTQEKPKELKPYEDINSKAYEKWMLYQCHCNENLLENQKALDYIERKRGITKKTIEDVGLGIDTNKRNWAIPVYNSTLMNEIRLVGFEYRKSDFTLFGNQKCIKETGTPSCMAEINTKGNAEILIILEGFWDGYLLYQYLTEQKQDKFYHIVTPSCGVGTVVGLLEKFDFSPYKRVILYLDSDEKGIKAMNETKALFPFIETKVMKCGCVDFNEHYLKCIKGGNK